MVISNLCVDTRIVSDCLPGQMFTYSTIHTLISGKKFNFKSSSLTLSE